MGCSGGTPHFLCLLGALPIPDLGVHVNMIHLFLHVIGGYHKGATRALVEQRAPRCGYVTAYVGLIRGLGSRWVVPPFLSVNEFISNGQHGLWTFFLSGV